LAGEPLPDHSLSERTNPISPAGFAALRAEYDRLFAVERPAVVEIVSWAAGNGDRSENGDYIYGKQKLRAIDRDLGRLSKKMKSANVIDPSKQPDKSRIFFGATVTIADEHDNQRTITVVGDDEADAGAGRVGWNSPLARMLRGASVGDLRTVQLPGGPKEWEVVEISYPG
jgi:transcription elongation factor GreB